MKKIIVLVLLIYAISCNAQVDRTFWFAAPKITDGHPYMSDSTYVSFKIAAMDLDANVTVSMPQNPAFIPQNFTVPAGQSYIDILAETWPAFQAIYNNTSPIGTSSVSDHPGAPENKGFLITSDNDITVYYDYDVYWNRELYVLKGQNALGTEFYTPFQNIWGCNNNSQNNYNPKPKCAIDIVATVDNTTVTITPPVLPPPANPATPVFEGYANNNPIVVNLNHGQSFSLIGKSDTSWLHPTGTHIVSNQPIAVTQNDDTQGVADTVIAEPNGGAGCFDVEGNQLVPVSILGNKYCVMTGTLSINPAPNGDHNPDKAEQIFVLATQPNTVVYFYGKDGTLLYTTATLNAGQEDYYSVDIGNANKTSIFIKSNGPDIYVWHITGTGCEIGGAVLPPITNCTGSTAVPFYRSGSVQDIQVNLMIPYDTTVPFNSPTQSYNFFTLYYSDGTPPFKIPGSWFEPNIPSGWAVLQFAYRDFNAITHMGQAHTIKNTNDFFHMGMINGTSGVTDKYGYFSSYNVQSGGARVANTETNNDIVCLGDTITLAAEGGLSYAWSYGAPGGPATYISDPTNDNTHVFPPVGNSSFFVKIHRSECFGDTTIQINTTVLAPVTANFETSQTAACAPAAIQFTNQSIGNINNYWQYQENNNAPVFFTPTNQLSFTQQFNNKTTPYSPINYTYTLIVDDNEGCSNEMSKVITVYPEINADMSVSDSVGCNPLPVSFSAKLSGGDTLNWAWNFGDHGSSAITNPGHSFYDLSSDNKDTIFHVQLVATSPNYCTDTVRQNIHVYPFLKADFTVDTVTACAPFTIKISNNSSGAASQYNWDFGDGNSSTTNGAQFVHTYNNNTNSTIVYKFKLTVYNKFGCTDTLTRFITVFPQPLANFTTSGTQGCNPYSVSFTNLSNQVSTKYLWDFGDGSTSDNENVTHQYVNNTDGDAIFNARLTVTTNNNCVSADSTNIKVHPFLDPSFTLSSSSGCTPFTDTITNKSTGGIKKTPSPYGYVWNFGDGSPVSNDTMPTFTHYFINTSNKNSKITVTLTLTDLTGNCSASLSRNVTLYPQVLANYHASSYNVCDSTPVTFNNNSDSAAVHFIWDFGDGSSDTMKSPVHIFRNFSSNDVFYNVKLTAISSDNCTYDTTQVITVYPYILPVVAINKPAACSPDTVTITDGSLGGVTQYSWSYGDGNTDNNSSPLFTHIYTNKTNTPITYDLRLTVYNHIAQCNKTINKSLIVYPEVVSNFSTQDNIVKGCDSLNINFINLSGPTPVPTHYNWYFGDGGSSNSINASHLYIHPNPYSPNPVVFTSKLYAYSQYNCYSIDSQNITVYPYVRANFSVDQPDGCSPLNIAFIDSSSPGANEFLWNFGNGVINNNSAHSFTQTFINQAGGVLTVNPSLTVTYNGNCPSTMTTAIQVYSQVYSGFTQDTLKGCHPIKIDFTNTSLYAQRYNWSFGDLASSVLTNPSHTYTDYSNTDSVYNVTLTATSEFNCTNSITKQVIVYPKPKARFNFQNSISCSPFQLSVANMSEAGNTYFWNFGDGTDTTTLDLENVNHTFDDTTSSIATYPLVLAVSTNFNCTDSVSQLIQVYPRVVSGFEPDTANCSTVIVQFRNQTQQGSTYLWNFGDGVTSNLAQPVHDFFNLGVIDTIYTVNLISYSQYGCIDSSSRKVTVYPDPIAAFSALPRVLDFPSATVNIANETNAGTWNYLWNFGDNTSESVKDPQSHTYLTWGDYIIRLKVWNNNCSDSASTKITIVPPVPIADFVRSSNICLGLAITFTDNSSWATSWNWNFGDSATSNDQNPPPHVYPHAGIYHVQLIVTGDGGTDVTTQDVEVYPLPIVQFTPVPTLSLLPDAQVRFYNTSQLGVRYLWNFGDNQQSTDEEPVHTYQNLGIYTVSLGVWTENNCYDSTIMVNEDTVIGGGIIKFPNVFSPSTNGPNGGAYKSIPDPTIFYPYSVDVIQYDLEIYDRWGEKLFESTNINIGWDGYYQGQLCKGDVYVWIAKGKFTNGQTFNLAGTVTLLR